ncbi:MAG: 3-hydroxybutyrate oligomer hydrolase family protein [Wenzhouxiangella sp.]
MKCLKKCLLLPHPLACRASAASVLLALILVLGLVACQPATDPDASADGAGRPIVEGEGPSDQPAATVNWRISEHRGDDDLLSAGLGLAGLQRPAQALPPWPAAEAADLRRLAIHSAWTGLAALNPAGGVGGLLDDLPAVPGREFSHRQALDGRAHPVRYLVQLPDAFDPARPCLVAAAASGSRGVYGAISIAGGWGLPRGCAVVYTDKGAGTDFFTFDDQHGTDLDGRRRPADELAGLAVRPARVPDGQDAGRVYMPHAHSGDHPEADWGRHVLTSIELSLDLLREQFGDALDPGQVQVIATGLSNGAGAALRAAEQDERGLINAVVAVMPNITAPDAPPLYDYARLAAVLQPCLLADAEATLAKPLGNPLLVAAGQLRCESLVEAGWLEQAEPGLAREALLAAGFDEAALELAASNVALDLWRSVLVSYASAYLAGDAFDMPCGYGFSAASASADQRQAWWASHSGVGAGGGIELIDGLAEGADRALNGLRCLHDLAEGEGGDAQALRAAIEATRATARLPAIPVLVIHGQRDGLIPAALSARPYVEQARANGADIAYWEITRAQHFDALLALPPVAEQLVPILPYGWRGLDVMDAVLAGEESLGEDRLLDPAPVSAGQSQTWSGLGFED